MLSAWELTYCHPLPAQHATKVSLDTATEPRLLVMMLLDLNELLVEGGRVGLGPTVLMASSRRTGPGVLSVSCSLTTVPAVSLSADSLRLTRQPSRLSKLPGCFPDSLLHSLEKLVTKVRSLTIFILLAGFFSTAS